MEEPISVDAFINDEPNRPRGGEHKNDCIDPGDVIWEQKKATLGKVFESGRGHAINEPPMVSPWNMIYKRPVVPCNLQFDDGKRING